MQNGMLRPRLLHGYETNMSIRQAGGDLLRLVHCHVPACARWTSKPLANVSNLHEQTRPPGHFLPVWFLRWHPWHPCHSASGTHDDLAPFQGHRFTVFWKMAELKCLLHIDQANDFISATVSYGIVVQVQPKCSTSPALIVRPWQSKQMMVSTLAAPAPCKVRNEFDADWISPRNINASR